MRIGTGLFSDPTLPYGLAGETTTMGDVKAQAKACDPDAGLSTVGSRLRRCGLYEAATDRSPKGEAGAGRPALVFARVAAD